jgi:hypothetical protein
MFGEQAAAYVIEQSTLLCANLSRERDADIGVVHVIEVRTIRWNDFDQRQATVESRRHHRPRAEHANAMQAAPGHVGRNGIEEIDGRKWREGFELLDAEVASNRRDNHAFGTSRSQLPGVPGEYRSLRGPVVAQEISRLRRYVGMRYRQV